MSVILAMYDRRWIWLASAILAVGVAGCGDGRPSVDSSRAEARVSGVVKFQGKVVTDGLVSFDPSNAERPVGPVSAKIGPDGTYSLTSFTGINAVKFSGAFLKGRPDVANWVRAVKLSAGENSQDFDILGENDTSRGPSYPASTRTKGKARGR